MGRRTYPKRSYPQNWHIPRFRLREAAICGCLGCYDTLSIELPIDARDADGARRAVGRHATP